MHHALELRKIDFVREVIGCDLSPDIRKAAEAEGFRTVKSVDELLREKPAVIVIVTPPSVHAANIRSCIGAKIPVLCEKPLTTDLKEAVAIVELAEKSGVSLQAGFELRYCGMTRGMKDIVGSGIIGEPRYLTLVQISGSHTAPGYMSKKRAGGIFYEKLCHQIDLSRFWFGEPTRIMAHGSPSVLKHYEIHDNVTSVMEFPDNRAGKIMFITSRAAQIGGTDDHGDRGHFCEIILTCANGSATFDHWTGTLDVVRFNHRKDLQAELVDRVDVQKKYGEPIYDLFTQDADFLKRVKEGKKPLYPASDALKTMAWVEWAEQSLAKGGEWLTGK
jgi:predicted dehydrogenase